MRICRTVADLRLARAGAPRPVGFVPTMGALHAGHGALLRRAREQCATVVASVFVNPLQFDEKKDLEKYPRPFDDDVAFLDEHRCDLLFAPPRDELYPDGFATTVSIAGPARGYEGGHRPGHFDGVATVVAKLFGIVEPDHAYFGQKDAQQLALVRRLVRDLEIDVSIVSVATVRDADGLALSSRNARLSTDERARALGISAGLQRAADAWAAGEEDLAALVASARTEGLDYEYLAAVDPETFGPPRPGGPVLLVTAVRVGETRLIDNVVLSARS
ncbi:MAG: pantoate--beta-alanine ligase [Planctomycetota bacterium]|nr:pantoate--beta-alanine ligase [Planctomycetota bacterium]